MKKLLIIVATVLFLAGSASAEVIATVDLDGDDYLQSGTVTNSYSSAIVGFVYSLGGAADGIASWDFTSKPAGVTFSDPIGSRHFQTASWTGLNIASGESWTFGSLDIDLISPYPTVTDSVLDNVGTSLRDAYVSVLFEDGLTGTISLNQTGWHVDQQLEVAAVPVPAALWLLGSGLAGLLGARRIRK